MLNQQATKIGLLFAATTLLLGFAALPQEPEKKAKEKKETTNLRIEVTGGGSEKPVAGAQVDVYVESEPEGESYNTTTNDAGVAKVSKVPRGKALIQVTADGWKTFGQRYELTKEEQTIKIVLEKKKS